MPINQISEQDIEKFDVHGYMNDYQDAAIKSAIYPGQGKPIGLMYCALKLNGEAGELAEHVGKAMRDDRFGQEDYMGSPEWDGTVYLTPERRKLIIKEVGDCLWYLAAICKELGIDFTTAAVTNLEKLRDRQLRGVQQGSGDDR